MKPLWVILFALSLSAPALHAQERGIYTRITQEVIHGDTVTVAELMPVFVFPRKIDTADSPSWSKTSRKSTPLPKRPTGCCRRWRNTWARSRPKREQQLFTKAMERKLKEQYAPVLRRMTFSQGKLLIKLIDRETGPNLLCAGQGAPQRIQRIPLAGSGPVVRHEPQGHLRPHRRR